MVRFSFVPWGKKDSLSRSRHNIIVKRTLLRSSCILMAAILVLAGIASFLAQNHFAGASTSDAVNDKGLDLENMPQSTATDTDSALVSGDEGSVIDGTVGPGDEPIVSDLKSYIWKQNISKAFLAQLRTNPPSSYTLRRRDELVFGIESATVHLSGVSNALSASNIEPPEQPGPSLMPGPKVLALWDIQKNVPWDETKDPTDNNEDPIPIETQQELPVDGFGWEDHRIHIN